MKKSIIKAVRFVIIFGLLFGPKNLHAQYNELPFNKSINWSIFSSIIKSKAVTEILKTFKEEKEMKSNITLIDFEQDFSEVNNGRVYSDFKVLITFYHSETGHMLKAINGKSYIAKLSCLEEFDFKELKAYNSLHSSSTNTNLYSDICPWRQYKSYKVSIDFQEMSVVKTL